METRNIRWPAWVDYLAVQLADERKCKRGVSELLEELVKMEKVDPRIDKTDQMANLSEPPPGYADEIRRLQELHRDLQKKRGKKH